MTAMRLSLLIALIAVLSLTGVSLTIASSSVAAADTRTPILVELFTSEGCSSCPPADKFLAKLDGQPVAGAELIVLSEHVDYWNHIGWKDPYSSRFYSDRQSTYAQRFGLDGPYTPQIVVDGVTEFVGSNSAAANKAFGKALGARKLAVHLSSISVDGAKVLQVHVDAGPLDASFALPDAGVYVAVALNRAESQVSAGENAGSKLTHVSVVRSLEKVGDLKAGQGLSKDLHFKLESGTDLQNLRVIAFVQAPGQGRVVGAALAPVAAK
jgi:hypothetical protein